MRPDQQLHSRSLQSATQSDRFQIRPLLTFLPDATVCTLTSLLLELQLPSPPPSTLSRPNNPNTHPSQPASLTNPTEGSKLTIEPGAALFVSDQPQAPDTTTTHRDESKRKKQTAKSHPHPFPKGRYVNAGMWHGMAWSVVCGVMPSWQRCRRTKTADGKRSAQHAASRQERHVCSTWNGGEVRATPSVGRVRRGRITAQCREGDRSHEG